MLIISLILANFLIQDMSRHKKTHLEETKISGSLPVRLNGRQLEDCLPNKNNSDVFRHI